MSSTFIALFALLCPPLPRRHAAMRMHTQSIGLRQLLLLDVVGAVPHERPRHPFSHHDGAEVLTVGRAACDCAPV